MPEDNTSLSAPVVATAHPAQQAAGPIYTQGETLEQRRAAYAWNCVQSVSQNVRSDYRGLTQRLPAMIQTNGLGATIGFLMSKINTGNKPANAHRVLLGNLTAWLCDHNKRPIYQDSIPNARPHEQLLLRLSANNSRKLSYATTEAMALAGWLKRFADADEKASSGTPAGQPSGDASS